MHTTELIAGYTAYTTSGEVAAALDGAPAVRTVTPTPATTGPVTTYPTTITAPPVPSITWTD